MKAKFLVSIKSGLLLLGAICLPVGCASVKERDVTETTDPNRHSMVQVEEGYDTFGRRWGTAETSQKVAEAPPPKTTPIRTEAPAPSKQLCAAITTGLVNMTKTMPAEVSLGQEFMYELNLTAVACAGNVIVTDRIPNGAAYVRSEPAAQVQGELLIWKFSEMDARASISIKVWLKAEREGTLTSCATLSADPRLCASTFVGKPLLSIEKTGPATALLNSDVAYNIVVANKGTAIARNVVVTDEIPDGLSHSSGQSRLTFNVGDLAPNQSKAIPVTLKAVKRGKFCNNAIAVATNVGKVSDDACTTVVQPGLKIVKSTTDNQLLINRTASYDIEVSNTGDTPLTGVVVSDSAAAETSIVSAQGGSINGNTATWNIGPLGVGQKRTLNVKIMSKTPGRFCNTASVTSGEGLKDSSQACSEWIGVTGVAVEVVDDPDPIQVGETTTFTIRVTNQGSTIAIQDLVIKAFFPEETTPSTASGGGTVSGKNVTWPPVASVPAKQTVTYTIQAKGVKAGDSRMRVEVTTRVRQTPITELESTTVY
jgi:uncharacterized repeat protein (TIGR01451 family)